MRGKKKLSLLKEGLLSRRFSIPAKGEIRWIAAMGDSMSILNTLYMGSSREEAVWSLEGSSLLKILGRIRRNLGCCFERGGGTWALLPRWEEK